ncbi:MAG: PAS domain-containing sensor histidine kinase [Pseudomonadota bacterium]
MRAWRDPQRIADAGRGSLFPAAFALAGVGLVLAVVLASSSGQAIGAGSPLLNAVLAFNAVVILIMAVAIGVRAGRHVTGRRFREPAPRLHIRFLTLFALAAMVPAILIAAFSAVVLNRAVEFWFGERVSSLVEVVADFGRQQAPEALTVPISELEVMAQDLSEAGPVEGLSRNRILYVEYLRTQARGRGFPAAYVIDGRSTVLARAEFPTAPAFAPPSASMFAQLEADPDAVSIANPVQRQDQPDYVRLLKRLSGYSDAYLYIVHYADFRVFTAAEAAILSLREARAEQQRVQLVFGLIYIEATLLVLVGAVWLALSAANRVVRPVGRLVSAAERVRGGDFDARVEVRREQDEIAALGRSFNRMTRQLGSQRDQLVAARGEAERRRAFIEAVLEGVEAGVIGADETGRITLINRAAAELLNLNPQDAVGAVLAKVAPVFEPLVEEARRRRGYIPGRQLDALGADGAVLHLNVRAARDEDGGLVVTFDDITRLVAAQRNAAWRDVARRVAHEIKNPLTPIQLSAERLRRKYRDEVTPEGLDVFDRCVDTIVRQVSDIGRMVDEFSAFARMPAPKMEVVDLVEVAESALFARRVASPNVRFTLERPDEPALVECDSRLVGQAVANVLKNAAESVTARMEADGGKAKGSVRLDVRREHEFAIMEICDDGLGWPSVEKSQFTEPYITTREKGTGLGLAIVRRVMEDHGGRLELDDPVRGRGAVVRLAFPLLEEAQAGSSSETRAEA